MSRTVEELQELSDQFTKLVRLQSYPVAVKMIKDLSEVEDLNIKKPDRTLTACQIISQAYFAGLSRIATVTELSGCPVGAACLGLMELPEEYKRGEVYYGSYHKTKEISRSVMDSIPKFNMGEYKGILVSPLEKCQLDPDVVIFGGNVSQIMVFVRSYLHDKGGRIAFDTCTMAGCIDLIVTTMLGNKPTVTLPCLGYRLFAFPSDSDLFCGVPGGLLEDILEGIRFNYQGGVVYPTAWQHLVREMPLIWPYTKYLQDQFEDETH
jgi:uncharacterized protein (DUF169 family)